MNARGVGALLEQARTRSIIGAFFAVFNELGSGFREYLYSLALERELVARGHRIDREVAVMVYYAGEPLAWQTIDMIVDEKIVLEIKATESLPPNAKPQLFGYLCASKLEVGLLLHFGHKPQFYRVICENRLKRHVTGPAPDPPLS
jgi:GxxExxY protein